MQTYPMVDSYMQELGLKYYRNANEFIASLALKTDKKYAGEVADLLNSRARGENSNNHIFYKLKNESLAGSLCISSAFDSGLFRHLGNMIIDNADYFKGVVLDVGCDCGMVSCFIAKAYPDCRVVGVDCNELAVNNARELATKLGLDNISFETADIYDFTLEGGADTITSFRGLLDITQSHTKGVPVMGERSEREGRYEKAFEPLAQALSRNLKENGSLISVERYTALYGWLGWLQALSVSGINGSTELCSQMIAQDISSPKSYSVTFAGKGIISKPIEVYNKVMSARFKSGAGCDGADAEFALYEDGRDISFTDVYKEDKLIHQFATAQAENGKWMFYEADQDTRKIKYVNDKKKVKMQEDFDRKLKLYNGEMFVMKQYNL